MRRLAITYGDAAGIGPELVLRLLAEEPEAADSVAVGDADVLQKSSRYTGLPMPKYLLNTSSLGGKVWKTGEAQAICGEGQVRDLQAAVDLCKSKETDGLLYAPLNKHAIHLAGYKAAGSIPLLAGMLGADPAKTAEINVVDNLCAMRVTGHMPLKDAAASLTRQAIEEKIEWLHDFLLQKTGREPRLAVLGLNPHNGENGDFGNEEITCIAPAVEAMRQKGVRAEGPFAADSFFYGAFRGAWDGVITMYHDQGLIALKAVGFDRIVTVPGGIPLQAATPAHGTAYDKAWNKPISTTAMRAAYNWLKQ